MNCSREVDRLSDLPWDILDNILGCLPIEDAVRTSILSKKWRYKWVDLSKIVVDEKHGGTDFLRWSPFDKFVYNVLLAHRGQIDKFIISATRVTGDDLDNWIDFLCRNGVKKLILDVDNNDNYELPDCLFSSQQLSCLYALRCSVIPPLTFNGFSDLVSLQLESCIISEVSLENFISSCPILQTLALLDIGPFDSLIVDAPNLKSLRIEGTLTRVNLENCPHLTDVSINMVPIGNVTHVSWLHIGFTSCLERLTLSCHLPRGFPVACDNLKFLELSELQFDELDEISVFLSLLRSTSNLKALCISGSARSNGDVYELMTAQNHLSWSFNQLKTVEINIFTGARHQEGLLSYLEFIKLVLACSPMLEKMLVYYEHPEDSNIWFMRKLLSFKRASAKLIFKYTSIPNPHPEKYWSPRHYDEW